MTDVTAYYYSFWAGSKRSIHNHKQMDDGSWVINSVWKTEICQLTYEDICQIYLRSMNMYSWYSSTYDNSKCNLIHDSYFLFCVLNKWWKMCLRKLRYHYTGLKCNIYGEKLQSSYLLLLVIRCDLLKIDVTSQYSMQHYS